MSGSMQLQSADQRSERLKTVIRNFCQRESGVFFILSKDYHFIKNFNRFLNKILGLEREHAILFTDAEVMTRAMGRALARRSRIVLVVEREMEGLSNVQLIKYVKIFFPKVLIILLTAQLEGEHLILLHELGTDNFLTKPVSTQQLLEKFALTIRPHGRMGQLVEQGRMHLNTGDPEKALSLAEQILEAKPSSASALILKGDCLRALHEDDQAIECYKRANAAARLFLEPLKKLAETYAEAGEIEEELEYLKRLDSLSPLNVERKVTIGSISLRMGRDDEARKIFNEAVKITTNQALSLISGISKNIAEQCMKLSPEMAEHYLRHSLKTRKRVISKSDVETYNALGMVLRQQGKWEDALKGYDKALEIAPQDENLHYNRALALVDGERYGEALASVRQALSLTPDFGADSDQILYNLGYVFHMAGESSMALEYFQASLENNPDNPKAEAMLRALTFKS